MLLMEGCWSITLHHF